MPGGLKNDNRKHFAVCSADSKTSEQRNSQLADRGSEGRDFEEQLEDVCLLESAINSLLIPSRNCWKYFGI